MTTIPADIGPNNMVSIPPNQQVSYVSDLLEIDLESSGSNGLSYFGSMTGGNINFGFLGYDTATLVDGNVQNVPGVDSLGFAIQSPGASFELSKFADPTVPPAKLLISESDSNAALRVFVTQSAEGFGVSVGFIDPSMANGALTWPATLPFPA